MGDKEDAASVPAPDDEEQASAPPEEQEPAAAADPATGPELDTKYQA
jgi:hypothetical protein